MSKRSWLIIRIIEVTILLGVVGLAAGAAMDLYQNFFHPECDPCPQNILDAAAVNPAAAFLCGEYCREKPPFYSIILPPFVASVGAISIIFLLLKRKDTDGNETSVGNSTMAGKSRILNMASPPGNGEENDQPGLLL